MKTQNIVENLAHKELLEALKKELDALSDKDRLILKLHVSKISTHEIARTLNMSQRTVYDRIQRLLLTLENHLKSFH